MNPVNRKVQINHFMLILCTYDWKLLENFRYKNNMTASAVTVLLFVNFKIVFQYISSIVSYRDIGYT